MFLIFLVCNVASLEVCIEFPVGVGCDFACSDAHEFPGGTRGNSIQTSRLATLQTRNMRNIITISFVKRFAGYVPIRQYWQLGGALDSSSMADSVAQENGAGPRVDTICQITTIPLFH